MSAAAPASATAGSAARAPAAARAEKRGPSPWLPRALFAVALLPLCWLGLRALLGKLGADPVAEVLNRLGFYTIMMLLGSLSCTPLQILFKWKWPVRVRRELGLFAFFYACLHVTTYLVIDQGLSFPEIWKDVLKRRFITLGMATFLLLLPLAITSTQKMVKRLGFRRWKRLHRLAYAAGVSGCIHYLWRFKLNEPAPIAALAFLLLLFAVRLGDKLRAARVGGGRRTV